MNQIWKFIDLRFVFEVFVSMEGIFGFEDGSKNFPKVGKGLSVLWRELVLERKILRFYFGSKFWFSFYYLKCLTFDLKRSNHFTVPGN